LQKSGNNISIYAIIDVHIFFRSKCALATQYQLKVIEFIQQDNDKK